MATRRTFGKVVYESRLPEMTDALMRVAFERAYASGNIMRNLILQGMSGPKHGRWYRIPGTKTMYRASAPGEYPAVRLGGLRTSIRVHADFVQEAGETIARAVIGTHLIYGMFLETGTRAFSHIGLLRRGSMGYAGMAPRPWLTMAIIEARPQIERILSAPWRLS